ncbi:MAG: glycosyltransferase family 4 protein [Clostridia bacterium]|nr:glycosyltransferase family 4 protein [Clostridia bacterium]
MKILVVCQHYWPEPFPITDICEALAERGHTVHVVTDIPNYPMGYIFPEYKRGKNRRQEHNGVSIFRTFTVGRRNNIFFRMLNYFSYAISSTHFVRRTKEDYDVVFTTQGSPVMMVNAAMVYAKKRKKKTVLYCMDLWPASLAAGGVGENSPIYKVFHWISNRLYHKADRILITSRMFREYFKEQFGIGDDVIAYQPQYADARFDQHLPEVEKDGTTVDLLFAGNVGKAQSIPTILYAAKILSERQNLRWHIVGDGSALEDSKHLAAELGLENVIFHGRKPVEEMPRYYAMADAMLVTLTADPLISLTLPAKVQSYMAAGKPILAASDGEIPKVISAAGCGFCAASEDATGLAEAVGRFLDAEDKAVFGSNARRYYQENFTRTMCIDKLEQELKNACRNGN